MSAASAEKQRAIMSGVRDIGPTGSIIAFLFAIYTGVLPVPGGQSKSSQEADGVTLGELVRTVSRVEGAVNQFGSTITAKVDGVDRRMIQLEIHDKAQDQILSDHGTAIRDMQAKKP